VTRDSEKPKTRTANILSLHLNFLRVIKKIFKCWVESTFSDYDKCIQNFNLKSIITNQESEIQRKFIQNFIYLFIYLFRTKTVYGYECYAIILGLETCTRSFYINTLETTLFSERRHAKSEICNAANHLNKTDKD
jgi:hypothetical protein